jgi:hypothetical protein
VKTEEVSTSVLKMAAFWIPAWFGLVVFARLVLTVSTAVCVGVILLAVVAIVAFLAGFQAGEAELNDE